jgi:hypothetical protein
MRREEIPVIPEMDERRDNIRHTQLAALLQGKRRGVEPHAMHVGGYVRRDERIGQPFTQEEAAEALATSLPMYAALEDGAPVETSAEFLDRLAVLFSLRDDERAMLFRLAIRKFAVSLTSTSLLVEGPAPNSAYVAAVTSPTEIDAAARELARIRDRYLEDGSSSGAVRPRIADSWRRCRELRVDPSLKNSPLRAPVDDLRSANERLLRAATATVARLADDLAGTGYIVVVTDPLGRLLDVIGDRAVQRAAARLHFERGGDWSEAAIGTNAIGTAIADRRPLQLIGGEHFCDAPIAYTCTAAPIYGDVGQIAGVLDISGAYELVRPHLVGVIMQAALEIEERLASL